MMKTRETNIKIMGSCAGMLIAAGICEQIAKHAASPYLVLFCSLAIGFAGGYLLTKALLKMLSKK